MLVTSSVTASKAPQKIGSASAAKTDVNCDSRTTDIVVIDSIVFFINRKLLYKMTGVIKTLAFLEALILRKSQMI
jgi:hypothetical protein